MEVLLTQSVSTRCGPMDYSPPGFSVCGIPQARTLDWVAIPFSRGSSCLRDHTWFPALQADSLQFEPPWKPPESPNKSQTSLLQALCSLHFILGLWTTYSHDFKNLDKTQEILTTHALMNTVSWPSVVWDVAEATVLGRDSSHALS